MPRFRLVKIFVIGMTLFILGFDLVLIWMGGHADFDNSISSQLYTWSLEYPVIVTASSVLIGHLYLPEKPSSLVSRFWWLRVVAAVLAIGALSLKLNAAWLIATGVFAGHALWPNALREEQ